MKQYWSILLIQSFLVLTTSFLSGQSTELIVRWTGEGMAKKVDLPEASKREWLVKKLSVELLRFPDEVALERGLSILERQPGVLAWERNRPVDFRTDPDDPLYASEQNNLFRAGFAGAWDLTTGGQTTDGQHIVVAVLDAGFDVEHSDLRDNLWRNPGEIANDGVDNDGNGFVDDLRGWNFTDDAATFPVSTHGTQVIGQLGARGNNGRGVSGTNWDLSMMLFSIQSVGDIIAAYGYVLDQRRRYNETDGREGAFVVATNASFGVEGDSCSDYPVWGSLYDELGREGILTAASTANRPWDVDVVGDMPTDCPSEYLIGVTNLSVNDRLFDSSAFGEENVDLAAPGEESYSTLPNNRYGPFGSTSAAAPYVTGAIALLYATPCPMLLDMAREDPATAALLVREAILSSTAPNLSLTTRTATGGVLDVAAAQARLIDFCNEDRAGTFAIDALVPNPADTEVEIRTNALLLTPTATVTVYDALGRQVHHERPERLAGVPVRLRLPVAQLAAGWYLVSVRDREQVSHHPLIVR
ncbi:S8 family peptidase [Lewinella sp. W8]|uniref:S8 family peptidase n=1 Tax=Lewinella sp. W8 TaxID=2528208 RepID=UPI001068C0FA|nr:S8 family peptidase [Lewinella sp. W8]MTB50468.1 S8 family serine peptidase [Lewinella sp. W8]